MSYTSPKTLSSLKDFTISGTTFGKHPMLGYMNIDPTLGAAIGAYSTTVGGRTKYFINGSDLNKLLQAAYDNKLNISVASQVGDLIDQMAKHGEPSNWHTDPTAWNTTVDLIYKNIKNGSYATGSSPAELAYADNVATYAATGKPGASTMSYTDWVALPGNLPNAPDAYQTFSRQQNAANYIDQFFGTWSGLDTPAVRAEITKAINTDPNGKAIVQSIMRGDPNDKKSPLAATTAAFAQAYPGLAQSYKTNTPIMATNVAEYTRQIDNYKAIVAQYLPGTALSSQDMANLMLNHVTTDQLKGRVQAAYEAINAAPQEVRDSLTNLYGLDSGHLATIFLDPKNGEQKIMDDLRSREIYAQKGASNLTLGTAQNPGDAYRLAQMESANKVGAAETNRATLAASNQADLAKQQFGMQNQTTASGEQVIGANVSGFDQTQSQDALAVQQATQERQAASKAGGQYATSQKGGVSGAGRANQ